MDIISILVLTALLATITMTGFSYIISKTFKELYKEPVLLTYFLDELNLKIRNSLKNILAWMLHYLIGLGFVIVYHLIWTNQWLPITWEVGFFLGSVSGVIGIFGWIFIFRYTKYEPQIDFKGYYMQLLIAHTIFGLTAYAVYASF